MQAWFERDSFKTYLYQNWRHGHNIVIHVAHAIQQFVMILRDQFVISHTGSHYQIVYVQMLIPQKHFICKPIFIVFSRLKSINTSNLNEQTYMP